MDRTSVAERLAPDKLGESKASTDEHLFDPFPMLCSVVCLKKGPLKTILHRKMPSVVLHETNALQYIVRADAIEAGFWIPCRASDRQRFRIERQRRRKVSTTRKPPLWRGEPRPDREHVPVESIFPSAMDLQRTKNLWVQLELPWWPFQRPSFTYRYQRPSRAKLRMPKPTPSLETANREGWTAHQVVRAIEKHGWSDTVSNAVFTLVYEQRLDEIPGDKRLRVADVAAERGLCVKTLSQYVWLVRKELRGSAAADLSAKSSLSGLSVDKSGIHDGIRTTFTEERTGADHGENGRPPIDGSEEKTALLPQIHSLSSFFSVQE
jgi:hypothetical protein